MIIVSNKHLPHDLAQMQSLPLRAKIIMTQQRIRQWYEYFDGQVYVSFSGGKDSTVLKHIVDGMYSDVPAVFVNTGLEYPEIQSFVREIKSGKYDCFNSDVEILRPEMRFDEVVKKYGFPVVSKEVASAVSESKSAIARGKLNTVRHQQLLGTLKNKDGKPSIFNKEKWKFLLDAPFECSSKCCDVMKKKPAKQYGKHTDRKPFIGTMAWESRLRRANWTKHGCNAFDKKSPSSQPLSFWTEQDILHYIKEFNVPYCSVYGDIVIDEKVDGVDVLEGQINLIDYLGCYSQEDRLTTTGCDRTGCIFCMFGCHLEKEPNRFQRLKETHPRQYDYCINGGEYVWEGKYKHPLSGEWHPLALINDDGSAMTNEQIEEFAENHKDDDFWSFEKKWQPSKEGLGLGKVLDYIGVKYD